MVQLIVLKVLLHNEEDPRLASFGEVAGGIGGEPV